MIATSNAAPVDIKSLVAATNKILHDGEPQNISLDEHSGFTGYKPQWVIDAMNAVFGIGGWGFTERDSWIEQGEKGAVAISKVEVWLAGCDFRPTGWGQARVTRGDVGDAKKGAQTDGLKKAFSYFSIGSRAYRGELKKTTERR